MHHHFPCRFCSKTFLGIKFLESHLKVCNEKIENGNIKQKTDCEIEVDVKIPELERNSTKIYDFECKHCDQKFSSDFQLKIHVKLGSGDPIQCTNCSFKACTARGLDIHGKKCKKSTKRKNEIHIENPEMKKFKIGTNDKPYENSEIISSNQCFAPRKKLEIDDQSNHFKCNACDAEYTLRGNLIKHIETVHEEIRYNCPFCEFNFSKKYNLIRHIESVHEENVPLQGEGEVLLENNIESFHEVNEPFQGETNVETEFSSPKENYFHEKHCNENEDFPKLNLG